MPVSGTKPPVPEMVLEEQVFDFGRGRQRVLVQGDPDGVPVLLLHGATFRAGIWRDLGTLELLAQNGYRAFAADLPGHGKSSRSGFSAERHLEKLVAALGLKRPVILGHSYAGAYIFPYIARNADQLRGAVLISPSKIKAHEGRIRGKRLPVLIMWGRRDDLIPVSFAGRLQSALPNARTVIFEEAGHECYNHATTEFHNALLKFLGSL